MLRGVFIAGILCATTFLSADEKHTPQVPENHVLIIGIDGIRRDAMLQAETPHLKQLIEQGAFAENTQILGERYQKNDTVSGPGWSSFLTGVWADKHGVQNNSFKGKNYAEFPHLFAYIKQQFPQAVTATFSDWGPIEEHIVSHAEIRQSFPAHGADDYTKKDQQVALAAIKALQKDSPHALFAYFGAVDETGHRHGFHPSVPEYMAAIETVDQLVGQLLETLRARPQFEAENWLILVSTDHGGQGTGHGGGHDKEEIRNTFLIVSGAAAKQGQIAEQTFLVDLPVTALKHLGVKIDPAWKLDGRPIGLK